MTKCFWKSFCFFSFTGWFTLIKLNHLYRTIKVNLVLFDVLIQYSNASKFQLYPEFDPNFFIVKIVFGKIFYYLLLAFNSFLLGLIVFVGLNRPPIKIWISWEFSNLNEGFSHSFNSNCLKMLDAWDSIPSMVSSKLYYTTTINLYTKIFFNPTLTSKIKIWYWIVLFFFSLELSGCLINMWCLFLEFS